MFKRKVWVVDQIGATFWWPTRRAAYEFAREEKARGADDLTVGWVPLSEVLADPKVAQVIADMVCTRGAYVTKRLTPTPEEFL